MKIIGLTGPIAAGKDEVVKILKRHGAYVIDVDELAHQLYAPQTPVWHELVKVFGSKVLMRGGRINRKRLGEIVFADKQKLQALDRIVHPQLKEKVLQLIKSHQSSVSSRQIVVINAAVLKEIGLASYVDEVWAVIAPRAARLKRLVKAGLSQQAARKMIDAQAPQTVYVKLADKLIRNQGTLGQLNAKVQASF
ncbi:MAG TPA: dephospho-CoA kinase [Candidatus Sulfotelmatobacter sp.]|nr:dephospho-CoA kinase [Candidatus Sulfotelmatobacter sp.]